MTLVEAQGTAIDGPARPVAAASPIETTTLDVEAIDPFAVARAALASDLETACWIRPSEGLAIVGLGRAWAVEPDGPGRFDAAEAAWARLVGDHPKVAPGGAWRGPMLLGGLGFNGERSSDEGPWSPFPVASLVLPAMTYVVAAGGSTLTLARTDDDTGGRWDGLRTMWERLTAVASRATEPLTLRPARRLRSHPDRDAWERLVALMAGAVGRGRLDKVVLARQVDILLDLPADPVDVIDRLARSAPESASYLFRREGRTFVGASPERLARVDGRRFDTVAVAGSARRGNGPDGDAAAAAALLASDKDREEHGVVVSALRSGLASIAAELHVADTPSVLTLTDLLHLVTPVRGELRERTGVLSLAGRLHPTPAVGGAPTGPALAMLTEHEGFDRGWYAGPVGWVGGDGGGELMVALRCGVLDGPRASVYAGCGIVADSDPGREWAESCLKLRPLLHALGVDPEALP